MAHADYDCCAVCDDKLSYNEDAMTKGEICSSCLKSLNQTHNLNVWGVEDFIAWIDKTPAKEVEKILKAVGFSYCCYWNAVDEAVALKLLDVDFTIF
jgi:hypothetical protein